MKRLMICSLVLLGFCLVCAKSPAYALDKSETKPIEIRAFDVSAFCQWHYSLYYTDTKNKKQCKHSSQSKARSKTIYISDVKSGKHLYLWDQPNRSIVRLSFDNDDIEFGDIVFLYFHWDWDKVYPIVEGFRFQRDLKKSFCRNKAINERKLADKNGTSIRIKLDEKNAPCTGLCKLIDSKGQVIGGEIKIGKDPVKISCSNNNIDHINLYSKDSKGNLTEVGTVKYNELEGYINLLNICSDKAMLYRRDYYYHFPEKLSNNSTCKIQNPTFERSTKYFSCKL